MLSTPFRVRNQACLSLKLFLSVQPHQRLAALGACGCARLLPETYRVKHVQRAVAVIGEGSSSHRQGTRFGRSPDGASCPATRRDDGPFCDGTAESRGRRTPDTDPACHRQIDHGDRARDCPLPGCHIALFSFAQTTGRQDRGKPATPRASGRLGVIAISTSGSDLGGVIFRQPVDEAVHDVARGKL